MSVARLTDIFSGEGRGWEWGGGWVEDPGVAVKEKNKKKEEACHQTKIMSSDIL